MKTGIIGCGNIADIYFSNSIKYFNNFEIVACADIKPEASKHYANIYNVENLTIDQILNNDEIELIINLTIQMFILKFLNQLYNLENMRIQKNHYQLSFITEKNF